MASLGFDRSMMIFAGAATKSLTAIAVGPGTTTVTSIAVTGAGFTVTTPRTLPVTLATGESMRIDVTYAGDGKSISGVVTVTDENGTVGATLAGTNLIDAHDHHCFHSPTGAVHTQPPMHQCIEEKCAGIISPELASKAGLTDADGNVKCPSCNCDTFLSSERKIVEVHAKLCTDETIHYPEWRKSGKITEEQFQTWKATLTPDELLGNYKRVDDVHVTVQMRDDEAALMDSDLNAFNALLTTRLKEKGEEALRFSRPYVKKTSKTSIIL